MILLFQIFVRSFWDTNNAILGLLFSVIVAACFTKVLRMLIIMVLGSGLEFYKDPNGNKAESLKTRDDNLKFDQWSFPGTRSTLAFAGLIFLFFYLNGKLKVWANCRPSLLKLVFLCSPLLIALMVAVLEALDREHRYYDSMAGAFIGTFFALAAYRMFYASIFDFSSNHMSVSSRISYSLSVLLFHIALDLGVLGRTIGVILTETNLVHYCLRHHTFRRQAKSSHSSKMIRMLAHPSGVRLGNHEFSLSGLRRTHPKSVHNVRKLRRFRWDKIARPKSQE